MPIAISENMAVQAAVVGSFYSSPVQQPLDEQGLNSPPDGRVDSVVLRGAASEQSRGRRINMGRRQEDIPGNPPRAAKAVLFAYNRSGEIRVRFMDKSGQLVYQVPSIHMSKIQDEMGRNNSSVNVVT
ncbi:MAG: hypothetical protein HYV06_04915 [Deltaproteobacteria bacterium]|nr:hypothetical protein [Deltaproteobacteria bacterium]